jgi:hypothetical protein
VSSPLVAAAAVTTTWLQNSLASLDCETRIARARSGFHSKLPSG